MLQTRMVRKKCSTPDMVAVFKQTSIRIAATVCRTGKGHCTKWQNHCKARIWISSVLACSSPRLSVVVYTRARSDGSYDGMAFKILDDGLGVSFAFCFLLCSAAWTLMQCHCAICIFFSKEVESYNRTPAIHLVRKNLPCCFF